jgi:hypothetical protein
MNQSWWSNKTERLAYVTNPVLLDLHLAVDSCWGGQEIPYLYGTPAVHYGRHKSRRFDPMTSGLMWDIHKVAYLIQIPVAE